MLIRPAVPHDMGSKLLTGWITEDLQQPQEPVPPSASAKAKAALFLRKQSPHYSWQSTDDWGPSCKAQTLHAPCSQEVSSQDGLALHDMSLAWALSCFLWASGGSLRGTKRDPAKPTVGPTKPRDTMSIWG